MEGLDSLRALAQLKRLTELRRYVEISTLLEEYSTEYLCSVPDVALALVNAWLHLHRTQPALVLTKSLLEHPNVSSNTGFLRRTLLLRSSLLARLGYLDNAQDCLEVCVRLRAPYEISSFAAEVSNNLGIVLSMRGEWEGSLPEYRRALSSYQQLGHRLGVACVLHNIALSNRYLSKFEEAERFFRRAADYYSTDGIPQELAFADSERSLAILGLGDARLAQRMVEGAIARSRAAGAVDLEGEALRIFGSIMRVTGRTNDSRNALSKALSKSLIGRNRQLRAEIHLELGALYIQTENGRRARHHLTRSLRLYKQMGATGFVRRVEGLLAASAAAEGSDSDQDPLAE